MQEVSTFILFEVAGTTYAVRSHDVKQVQMIERVTPLPNAPNAIEGVVYSSGQVIPAMNLRVRFGFEKVPFDIRSRVVVVNVEGRVVGLLVDTAREFVTIPKESIEPPPAGITRLSAQYLDGIATLKGRLVLVLKLAEVLDIVDAQTIPQEDTNGVKNENSGAK
jgi:purine-binding chemotaxis protein CheW